MGREEGLCKVVRGVVEGESMKILGWVLCIY